MAESSYYFEKTIYDRIANNKRFNEEDIHTIINYYIQSYSLEDYVSSISYRFFNKSVASYTALDKKLQLNPMLIYFYTFLIPKSCNINSAYNKSILTIILHEIAHVRQTKKSEAPIKTPLDKIISDAMAFGKRLPYVSKEELSFYYKNAKDMLFERCAMIEENIGILDLNDRVNILTPDDILFFNYNIYRHCLSNYQLQNGRLITPSEKFYQLMKDESFSQIKFNDDEDMLTTLEWGMPISIREFEYLKANEQEFVESSNIKKKILSLK